MGKHLLLLKLFNVVSVSFLRTAISTLSRGFVAATTISVFFQTKRTTTTGHYLILIGQNIRFRVGMRTLLMTSAYWRLDNRPFLISKLSHAYILSLCQNKHLESHTRRARMVNEQFTEGLWPVFVALYSLSEQ
jgi:hypothetical protein